MFKAELEEKTQFTVEAYINEDPEFPESKVQFMNSTDPETLRITALVKVQFENTEFTNTIVLEKISKSTNPPVGDT